MNCSDSLPTGLTSPLWQYVLSKVSPELRSEVTKRVMQPAARSTESRLKVFAERHVDLPESVNNPLVVFKEILLHGSESVQRIILENVLTLHFLTQVTKDGLYKAVGQLMRFVGADETGTRGNVNKHQIAQAASMQALAVLAKQSGEGSRISIFITELLERMGDVVVQPSESRAVTHNASTCLTACDLPAVSIDETTDFSSYFPDLVHVRVGLEPLEESANVRKRARLIVFECLKCPGFLDSDAYKQLFEVFLNKNESVVRGPRIRKDALIEFIDACRVHGKKSIWLQVLEDLYVWLEEFCIKNSPEDTFTAPICNFGGALTECIYAERNLHWMSVFDECFPILKLIQKNLINNRLHSSATDKQKQVYFWTRASLFFDFEENYPDSHNNPIEQAQHLNALWDCFEYPGIDVIESVLAAIEKQSREIAFEDSWYYGSDLLKNFFEKRFIPVVDKEFAAGRLPQILLLRIILNQIIKNCVSEEKIVEWMKQVARLKSDPKQVPDLTDAFLSLSYASVSELTEQELIEDILLYCPQLVNGGELSEEQQYLVYTKLVPDLEYLEDLIRYIEAVFCSPDDSREHDDYFCMGERTKTIVRRLFVEYSPLPETFAKPRDFLDAMIEMATRRRSIQVMKPVSKMIERIQARDLRRIVDDLVPYVVCEMDDDAKFLKEFLQAREEWMREGVNPNEEELSEGVFKQAALYIIAASLIERVVFHSEEEVEILNPILAHDRADIRFAAWTVLRFLVEESTYISSDKVRDPFTIDRLVDPFIKLLKNEKDPIVGMLICAVLLCSKAKNPSVLDEVHKSLRGFLVGDDLNAEMLEELRDLFRALGSDSAIFTKTKAFEDYLLIAQDEHSPVRSEVVLTLVSVLESWRGAEAPSGEARALVVDCLFKLWVDKESPFPQTIRDDVERALVGSCSDGEVPEEHRSEFSEVLLRRLDSDFEVSSYRTSSFPGLTSEVEALAFIFSGCTHKLLEKALGKVEGMSPGLKEVVLKGLAKRTDLKSKELELILGVYKRLTFTNDLLYRVVDLLGNNPQSISSESALFVVGEIESAYFKGISEEYVGKIESIALRVFSYIEYDCESGEISDKVESRILLPFVQGHQVKESALLSFRKLQALDLVRRPEFPKPRRLNSMRLVGIRDVAIGGKGLDISILMELELAYAMANPEDRELARDVIGSTIWDLMMELDFLMKGERRPMASDRKESLKYAQLAQHPLCIDVLMSEPSEGKEGPLKELGSFGDLIVALGKMWKYADEREWYGEADLRFVQPLEIIKEILVAFAHSPYAEKFGSTVLDYLVMNHFKVSSKDFSDPGRSFRRLPDLTYLDAVGIILAGQSLIKKKVHLRYYILEYINTVQFTKFNKPILAEVLKGSEFIEAGGVDFLYEAMEKSLSYQKRQGEAGVHFGRSFVVLSDAAKIILSREDLSQSDRIRVATFLGELCLNVSPGAFKPSWGDDKSLDGSGNRNYLHDLESCVLNKEIEFNIPKALAILFQGYMTDGLREENIKFLRALWDDPRVEEFRPIIFHVAKDVILKGENVCYHFENWKEILFAEKFLKDIMGIGDTCQSNLGHADIQSELIHHFV